MYAEGSSFLDGIHDPACFTSRGSGKKRKESQPVSLSHTHTYAHAHTNTCTYTKRHTAHRRLYTCTHIYIHPSLTHTCIHTYIHARCFCTKLTTSLVHIHTHKFASASFTSDRVLEGLFHVRCCITRQKMKSNRNDSATSTYDAARTRAQACMSYRC